MTLAAVVAEPRNLPYPECPGATANHRLAGRPVGRLRIATIEALPGVIGCTHLNDILRSLADVPALAAALPHPSATRGSQGEPFASPVGGII